MVQLRLVFSDLIFLCVCVLCVIVMFQIKKTISETINLSKNRAAFESNDESKIFCVHLSLNYNVFFLVKLQKCVKIDIIYVYQIDWLHFKRWLYRYVCAQDVGVVTHRRSCKIEFTTAHWHFTADTQCNSIRMYITVKCQSAMVISIWHLHAVALHHQYFVCIGPYAWQVIFN